MRITDENGKRVVTPDGISDDWLFFDETLLEDNEWVELYPTLERPDKERAKVEDSLTSGLIDLDKMEVGAMPLEQTEETLQYYQRVWANREQTDYLEDLRGAGVYEVLPEVVKSFLFLYLHLLIQTAMNNISKPTMAKYDIGAYIEQVDAMTGRKAKYNVVNYNTITKTLAVVGLVGWLEGIDVAEGKVGYYEYKTLLDWAERLVTIAVLDFCQCNPFDVAVLNTRQYKTFDVAGETDGIITQLLEVLRRMCAYLNGTKVGKDVQCRIRRVILGESVAETTDTQTNTPDTQTDTPEGKALPDELNTKKGRGLLQKTIEVGLLDKNFNWIANKREWGRYRVSLACYMMWASDYLKLSHKQVSGETQTNWKVFEDFIEFEGKSKSKAGKYIQIQSTKKNIEKSYISIKKTDEWARMSKFFEGLQDTSTPQQ